MAQCSKTDGNCNLQLESGTLKCKNHDNNEEIVGKLYAVSKGENFGTLNSTYNANNGLREPAYLNDKDYADESSYNGIELKLSEIQSKYKEMAASVAKYGGFYVGRYETSLSTATSTTHGDGGTVQSKKGVIPTSAADSETLTWYGLYSSHDDIYKGKA